MQQPTPGGGGGTSTELRSDAKQLGETAVNRIHNELEARKGTAVGQAKAVSTALERAVGETDPDTPDWLKSTLRQGAQKLQTFADTIEHKDSRELMRDAQDFARNNPGTFLAACAAAGFAAARILKAGGEQQGGARRAQGEQSRAATNLDDRTTTPAQMHADNRTRGEFA